MNLFDHRPPCLLIFISIHLHQTWRFGAVGSDVGQINEVTLHRARLVLGYVTVSGSTLGVGSLSQFNQPPKSTQPGHPSVGRRSEYQPKGGDALRLGVKADMVLFACDPYQSAYFTLLYFGLQNSTKDKSGIYRKI